MQLFRVPNNNNKRTKESFALDIESIQFSLGTVFAIMALFILSQPEVEELYTNPTFFLVEVSVIRQSFKSLKIQSE